MADSSRSDVIEDDLPRRLTQVFVDQFAQNTPHFGGGGPGYYGVRLENIASDGSEFDLVLTFRSGVRYCCIELGCHCGIRSPRYWSGLRKQLDAHGLCELPLPTIRSVRVVVEQGALIDLGGVPRGDKSWEYEEGPFAPVEDGA
jgi:hypothetical protein